MNVIDYYKQFIRVTDHISLIEKRKELDNQVLYNGYLYTYEDKLEGPERITGFYGSDFFMKGHVKKNQLLREVYIIFIPYNGYKLVLESDNLYKNIMLYIYNRQKCIDTYIRYNANDMIEFLGIDKLTEAYEFIITTFRMMDNITLNYKSDRYIKYKSLMRQSIDNYMRYILYNPDKNDEYYFFCKNKRFFLNIKNTEYTISKQSKGICKGIMYYFEIDEERSILIVIRNNQKPIQLNYYKNGKTIYNAVKFSNLESNLKMMLTLLNRKDIYEYLKQTEFFTSDIFYVQN